MLDFKKKAKAFRDKMSFTKTRSGEVYDVAQGGIDVFSHRPVDVYAGTMDLGQVAEFPVLASNYRFCFNLFYYSDILRTIVRTLVTESIRNGIIVMPRFISKCNSCGVEFDEKKDKCSVCGSEDLRDPDHREKKQLEDFMSKINTNYQTLDEMVEAVLTDWNVIDNSYLVALKRYSWDKDGNLRGAELKEILRGSCMHLRMIINKNGKLGYNDDGQAVMICLKHRSTPEYKNKDEVDNARCRVCGKQMFPAHYFMARGRHQYEMHMPAGERDKYIYYAEGEIRHTKKFTSTLAYGFPPVMCYDGETEILTENGWKKFSDLDNNEKVMTLVDGKAKYQKPVRYYEYDYSGYMYKLESGKVDLLVSPEHKMYVAKDVGGRKQHKPKLENIEDIKGKKYKYFKSADNDIEDIEYFVLPQCVKNYKHVFAEGGSPQNPKFRDYDKVVCGRKIKMDDWLEFLGWYLSEGSCCKGVKIAQSRKVNTNNYFEIEKCFEKLGYKPSLYDECINVYDKQLELYCKGLGDSHTKRIPREFLNLSKRQSRILVDSMMKGDGNFERAVYYTKSKGLADDFQELLLRAGYSGDVSYRQNKTQDIYAVQIRGYLSRNTNITTVNKHSEQDGWVDYEGKIYDVEVPEGHVLYVRRNGKVVWSGNSIWMKLMTLMKMDYFVLTSYHLQRSPKGLLVLRGNRQSLAKAWNTLTEYARINPNMIHPLVVEGMADTAGAKRVAEYIDLTVKSDEINFIEYRKELRTAMGMMYGVEPIFQGDTSTGEGLSNQGLQITVTNRAIENEQRRLNNTVLRWIADQWGAMDYTFKCAPHEEKDMQAQLRRELLRIRKAKAMMELGFMPIMRQTTDGVDFIFREMSEDEKGQYMSGNVGHSDMGMSPFPEEGEDSIQDSEQTMEGQPDMAGARRTGQRNQGEPDIPRE